MQRSPVFPRIPLGDEFKISSLNQETENSFVYSLECLQYGMFFCCVVAFSVGKVGGIVRRFSVFSMLSWLS